MILTSTDRGSSAEQASSCVAFLESMRDKFITLMKAGGGGVAKTRAAGWSAPGERARAAALARKGWRVDRIAHELHRSAYTISHWLRRAGVDYVRKTQYRGRPSHPRKAEAIEMLKEHNVRWVARQVGVSENCVYKWRRDAELMGGSL